MVAYGSQTGNAESIASDFHETIEQLGFNSKYMTLNKTKEINFQEDVKAFVIGIFMTDLYKIYQYPLRNILYCQCVQQLEMEMLRKIASLSGELSKNEVQKIISSGFRSSCLLWETRTMTNFVIWGNR